MRRKAVDVLSREETVAEMKRLISNGWQNKQIALAIGVTTITVSRWRCGHSCAPKILQEFTHPDQ